MVSNVEGNIISCKDVQLLKVFCPILNNPSGNTILRRFLLS